MWQAHQLIFDFLVYEVPGKRDEFRPALAKKWSISKNQKVFDFELREAKWTDGKPVTAEDVKFSLEHIYDPRFKSIWAGSFEGIEKIEVISPAKIRISILEPQFELLKTIMVSLKIVPKHFYSDPESSDYTKQALGSGPYKILNFESGLKFSLEKNLDWWGWKDQELKTWYTSEKIRFIKLSDVSIPAHFLKNELDYLRVTNIHLAQSLKKDPNLELDFVVNPNKNQKMVEQILLNLKSPLFSESKVREAINLAVDRKSICSKIYEGGKPFGESDLKKAQQLFKKTGWIDTDKDGILDKDGQSFEFTVIYASKDYEILLTKLKEQMKSIGLKINLQSIDYSLMQKTLRDKKFQSYIDRFDENNTILRTVWDTKGSYNYTGFSDAKVDAGLNQIDKIFESKRREKMTKELRKMISKAQPTLTLCEVQIPDFVINKKTTQANVRKGVLQWGWF